MDELKLQIEGTPEVGGGSESPEGASEEEKIQEGEEEFPKEAEVSPTE